ncbi:hypothetical protein Dhaf_3205 [Desulfitobacterium hafniense DCB-2]|uniref:DUF4083 domain-containing protein n=4 Tax=root TaxID=1 RepID=A0A098AZX5_DESHA|nr:hypothetical protein [Desulfitobacterium hafniense]ACL21225.1 hypothetical protein Dhaf_3205 [Desulfitobacterium hafniense DCB-2]EHL06604.1 hypothetical protein HMPREF0322_02653 [Desulfitobacterium hafniense DP7]KTE91405.1 hypothetical protein AT727_22480 [Desulfitobacterium hafniense]MEA5024915.1 hypothetical protein [Desulfitobacterium hafniense]CDX02128.1 Hypothetical protein DPCES_2241 [Desulfitobacterium hafniense]
MNPIHTDYTLLIQTISFLALVLFIGLLISIPLVLRKRKKDQEILGKLDRVIDILEREKNNGKHH